MTALPPPPPPSTLTGASVVSFGGNSDLNILFDDLKCTGSESKLVDCRRTSPGNIDCTHSEDVGVVCAGQC
jgi:hypothetical protein